MGRYSMYFGTRLEVEESIQREIDYKERKKKAKQEGRPFNEEAPVVLKPLTFNNHGKLQDKLNLEELDVMTSAYKDEASFILALSKCSAYSDFFEKAPDKHLIITHQSKGHTVKDEIIYNNKLIRKSAYETMIDNKRKKLSDSKELDDLVKRVKAYTLNPMSSKELRNSKYCDYMLKQSLDSYFKLKMDIKKENFSTPSQQDELFEIERSISSNMHRYKALRGIVVWEEEYLKKLENKNKKEQERANLDAQYKMMDINLSDEAKALVNEDKKIMEENSDILKEIAKEKQNQFIENDELAEIFNRGGTQAIMEEMSADDIYSNSASDLEKAGVFPKERSKKR